MKKFSLLLVAGLLLVSCEAQPDFRVELTVIDEENSEDSNSSTETLTIDGYRGTYTYVYDGYYPGDDFDPEQEYEFRLTDEDLQTLTLLIRENGLLVSRVDTVSTGDWWSSFEVTWDISLQGQSATGNVIGEALPYAQMDDAIQEDESKFAADQVMSFIQDKVGFND